MSSHECRRRLLTKCTASLRLQGTDAQNHAVYTELKRVQQYFSKIKAIEEPEGQRSTTVNQEAAARMLKADLVSVHRLLDRAFTDCFAGRQQSYQQ